MVLIALFFISGAVVVTIPLAKRMEEKSKKTNLILRAIALGNERAHDYHHQALHAYSIGKERADFWVRKQLPLRTKNWWNKFLSYVDEKSDQYLGEMRDVKLLKKSDGLSEFFKNISDIEKGGGEINEIYEMPVSIVEPTKIKRAYTRRKKVVEEAE